MSAEKGRLVLAVLYTLLSTIHCNDYHRRSSASRSLPISKGGWRPVVGSAGLIFGGNFGVAPLHHSAYRIPVPVIDTYQSSARPLTTRDAAKLTSIVQSYRPTTLRTVSTVQPTPLHQPFNTYHYQYPLPHPNLTKFKYVNYPSENIVIKNPHDPYSAKPIIPKYNFNLPVQNSVIPQFNIHPLHHTPHSGNLDVFGKPIQVYVRPDGLKKPQTTGTEIFKTEVYKLGDSEAASQSVNQQVKTAQQQNLAPKPVVKPYSPYLYHDITSNIIGPFGAFGVQSLQGREPAFPNKNSYLPPQPTKQTIFNSFNYTPNLKNSYQDPLNTYNIQTQQTPVAISANTENKNSFKASPQDPFSKHQQSTADFGNLPATTYNPALQTTTFVNNFNVQSQHKNQIPNNKNQQNDNLNYNKKKQKIHDVIAAGINEQAVQQYPKKTESETNINTVPFKATYEVTENYYENDSLPHSWTTKFTEENYSSHNNEDLVSTEEYHDSLIRKLTTTPMTVLPEEYAFVSENDYVNSLNYDGQLETQSRRPLGDDFEPIRKLKLKDYYRVSTPSQNDYNLQKRTKKPNETTKTPTHQDSTTSFSINKESATEVPLDDLPTLPPNKHFKRPNLSDPNGRDRLRKRTKLRRRRPAVDNSVDKENTNNSQYIRASTEASMGLYIADNKRGSPRIRPSKPTSIDLTTPSNATDLTTSAIPTVPPTNPTVIKKINRRPVTMAASKIETTVQPTDDRNKESQIMKITNTHDLNKPNDSLYEDTDNETSDYSHKQDEKDTPTSDTDILTDKQKISIASDHGFSFHRDSKPIEAKLEPVKSNIRETTTEETTTNDVRETATFNIGEPLVNAAKNETRSNLKNKNENNRPRFSVKDYRNRLSSTTTTTEKSADNYLSKSRFNQRKVLYNENINIEQETTTERKKFTPKEPRYKYVTALNNKEVTEKNMKFTRQPGRQKQTTVESTEATTQKISSRIRNGIRRPKPTEETTEITTPKRNLRKKIKDSELEESVHEEFVSETPVTEDKLKERPSSESAIMKIADKKHHPEHLEHIFEQTKRVSDLTLAASKDYSKGIFKNVSNNSRRIPNYFTIATDDPILPIEAFFPQLNQRKDS